METASVSCSSTFCVRTEHVIWVGIIVGWSAVKGDEVALVSFDLVPYHDGADDDDERKESSGGFSAGEAVEEDEVVLRDGSAREFQTGRGWVGVPERDRNLFQPRKESMEAEATRWLSGLDWRKHCRRRSEGRYGY